MSSNKTIDSVAVFGLGKLGACIAAAFASRGMEVTGVDVDPSKVEALAHGRAPVSELKLQETLAQAEGRLYATTDVARAVRDSHAAFFATPTPSLPDGRFNNEYLLQALRSVAEAVRDQGKERYLFVVNSTATPGSLDGIVKPLLEDILHGKCGKDFGLCYNPEFIALGDVIRGLLEPDFVLIGESDPLSGQLLEETYRRICTNKPPIERMSNINAELAKISVNCAVTMKISFVNQLSAVCAKIPGADPGTILRALGKDRRIGPDYLKPGLGYGGPCFPRDNRLFQYTARSVGVEAALAEATDKINEGMNLRLLETVLANSSIGDTVAVLGLAYKPFTNVVECSPGIWLCQQLAERQYRVFAHDYAAAATAASSLASDRIQVREDPREILENRTQTIVITCPWPAYKGLFESHGKRVLQPGAIIVDPWSLLSEVAPALNGVLHITRLT